MGDRRRLEWATMRVDQFIQSVTGEPERTVTRTVWTTPPDVLAEAARPGGVAMTKLVSAPGRRPEQRAVRYRHLLGSGAAGEVVDVWRAKGRSHALPADLLALVTRINGIHLWANAETGRSYQGLAPIEEWENARTKICGPGAPRDLLDDRFVALSYHQDGAAFIVLDLASGTYFLMDSAAPDTTSPIANNADELLDWLWQARIPPKP
jgi:hypothetical protein